jgi:class 3 adenylate cyclase
MEVAELKARLGAVVDRLVPVAGELMRRGCGDSIQHMVTCECPTCRAFIATQACQNELEDIIRALQGGGCHE